MPKHKPKYELTDQTIVFSGHTLHRIRALRGFSTLWYIVREGQLGGFVGSEDNLSHDSGCWLFKSAKAFEDAWVHGQAVVGGHAAVQGRAAVGGHAAVCGIAWVHGQAVVGGLAAVQGRAAVGGHAAVCGIACVGGEAYIEGKIHITTGHFTSGNFFEQPQIDAYLSDLKTKKQTHAQA